MKEMQLIYASKPFGYDDLSLIGILSKARINNARDGITGCLVCREDLYLQLLEGPRDAVIATYERILRDDRHGNIVTLWSGDIETRLFPEWTMRHDPARSWMWTMAEVARGVVGKASAQKVRGIFDRLAKEPSITPTDCPANSPT